MFFIVVFAIFAVMTVTSFTVSIYSYVEMAQNLSHVRINRHSAVIHKIMKPLVATFHKLSK